MRESETFYNSGLLNRRVTSLTAPVLDSSMLYSYLVRSTVASHLIQLR